MNKDDEIFLEMYEKYKDLIEQCIPAEVLKRLLDKARGNQVDVAVEKGDEQCPF